MSKSTISPRPPTKRPTTPARTTLALSLFVTMLISAPACEAQTAAAGKAGLAQSYGNLPLSFEANYGQADPSVEYLARGAGYGLYLTGQEAVLALHKPSVDSLRSSSLRLSAYGINPHPEAAQTDRSQSGAGPTSASAQTPATPETLSTDILRLQLAGANPHARPLGINQLPGTANYILGNNPGKWHTNIPTYSKVSYASVYPGIDLVYYGNQQKLEYDFVVAPGADPKPIRMRFAGAHNLKLNQAGDLTIAAHNGLIAFHKPVVYQTIGGSRHPVAGNFKLLADNSVTFALGGYDRTLPLIIDPVLVYSTYLGGSAAEFIVAAATDSSGAGYVTGLTVSTDFPLTAGAFQAINYASSANAVSTAFIAKFNASGTALLYSTFLGGNAIADTVYHQGDYGHAIAVDAEGNAYIAGYTYSNNFPITPGAYLKTNVPSENKEATGFVSKLNPTGTGLIYSTFLGGSATTEPGSIAIDSSGNAYISGQTFSTNFPVTSSAFQKINKSAQINGANLFVTKLNPAGSALVYSTYLGGSHDDGQIFAQLILTNPIAIDKSGNAYVASFTASGDFPVTKGAYQTVDQSSGYIATVSKLNPTGSSLLYSTYLGGNTNSSFPQGLAVDSSGSAYVAGFTACTDFPATSSAFQKINKADTNTDTSATANQNGFLTKLNPAGSALVYSTYLGGSTGPWGGDQIYAVALDSANDAYVAGTAMSANFPVTSNAYQSKNRGATHCCDYTAYTSNSFLTEFNPAGSALIYSTYLGGSGTQNPDGAGGYGDEGYALALANGGKAFIAGYSSSPNFPVTAGAFEPKYNSQQNTGFAALFDLGQAPTAKSTTTTLTASANPIVPGAAITFTAAVALTAGSGTPTGNIVFSIDESTSATIALNASGKAIYSTSALTAGEHYVLATYTGGSAYAPSGDGFNEVVYPFKPILTPAPGVYESQQTVTITDPTPGSVLYYTLDGSTPSVFSTQYTAPITVSASKTIHVIAVAKHDADSVEAAATYTIVGSPTVLAAPASAIATPKATVNAFVNTLGLAGSYYFRYGTTTALSAATVKTSLAASTSRVQVSMQLATLAAKTTYYYQVVVTTPGGVTAGAIQHFTTN